MPLDIEEILHILTYLQQHPTTNDLQRRFKISYFDACRLQAAASTFIATKDKLHLPHPPYSPLDRQEDILCR